MPKVQPMVTTVNADTKNREVAVIVEHADWQSFSRAVRPRGTKEFKRWVRENIVFGSLERKRESLAWFKTHEGRCISIMYFTY